MKPPEYEELDSQPGVYEPEESEYISMLLEVTKCFSEDCVSLCSSFWNSEYFLLGNVMCQKKFLGTMI